VHELALVGQNEKSGGIYWVPINSNVTLTCHGKRPLFLVRNSDRCRILVACHLYWIPLLPERLASHFDGAGLANGWMSRFNLYALSFDFAGNSRFYCRTAFLDEATG
jgi:hypothetical protein